MAAASTMAAAVSGVILIAASALLCCLLAIPYLLLLWSLFSAVQRCAALQTQGLFLRVPRPGWQATGTSCHAV